MVNSPLRPCLEPGCPELVRKGRCTKHEKQREIRDDRISSARRGYGSRWRKIRAIVLERDHYICQSCGSKASDVDHIIPKSDGGTNELLNLQSLCHECHSRKTARTDGRWRSSK